MGRHTVSVDGHNMSVYEEGSGAHTLVFLAGSGISSPILEYKALYRALADNCRVVVIERFGYGYSDVIDSERSFGTIVKQDREALNKAGIEGPFVLCPHSMAGVEALKWASDHPSEVEAVIGLDMAVPEAYDTIEKRIKSAKTAVRLVSFLRRTGIIKLMSNDMLSIPKTLTKEERKEYRSIFCSKFGNVCIMNESAAVSKVRDELKAKPKPSVPMLLFVSDGTSTGDDEKTWRSFPRRYAEGEPRIKIEELSCGHDLHNVQTGYISGRMREFLGML